LLLGSFLLFPCRRQDCAQVVLVGHDQEPRKDVLEIGEWVHLEFATVLDESVDDGTAPAGVFCSDEEPVLGTELERSHGIFREVVVDLDFANMEVDFESVPLVERVAHGVAQLALGEKASFLLLLLKETTNFLDDGPPKAAAIVFSNFGRMLVDDQPCSELGFYSVEFSDELEEGRGLPRGLLAGLKELAPHMSPTTCQQDEALLFATPLCVADVAVTLDHSLKVFFIQTVTD